MNTINLTTELCAEDRARLDTLIQELRVVSDTAELIRQALVNGTIPAAPQAVAAVQPEPEAEPAPEEKAPTEPQEAAEEDFMPWVTLTDIQKKVVGLSTAGKKDAVKAIVQEYAAKVSAIPEDKLAEVLARLTALEG